MRYAFTSGHTEPGVNTKTIECGPSPDEADSVTVAVVQAIADQADADPMELPPLGDTVDPDALEALFAPTTAGRPRTGRVEFAYWNYHVTVQSGRNGTLSIGVEPAVGEGAFDTSTTR